MYFLLDECAVFSLLYRMKTQMKMMELLQGRKQRLKKYLMINRIK